MTKEHKMTGEEHYKISDHLSNERTYLAWIRTCIGIIAFGFVVERFTYFFKRLVPISKDITGQAVTLPAPQAAMSSVFGMFLICFGTALGVFSYITFLANEKHIEQGTARSRFHGALVLAVGGLVFFMGLCFVSFFFFP
jgi:putative membrane protein